MELLIAPESIWKMKVLQKYLILQIGVKDFVIPISRVKNGGVLELEIMGRIRCIHKVGKSVTKEQINGMKCHSFILEYLYIFQVSLII